MNNLFTILYIKVTVSVCLSGQFPSIAWTFVFCFFCFFVFDGFCFLCQLNCPNLCFFFLGWVLFSVLVKLPGPLFVCLFFLWVLFFVSIKLPEPLFVFFFFGMGFVFCVS